MVDFILLRGNWHPIFVVCSVLMVAVVFAGVYLTRATIMRSGFAAIPFRGHLTKEVIKQVRHCEAVFEDASAGKYDGKLT